MTVKFTTENVAFEEELVYEESARILREIANQIEQGKDYGTCFDSNGNKVGKWSF